MRRGLPCYGGPFYLCFLQSISGAGSLALTSISSSPILSMSHQDADLPAFAEVQYFVVAGEDEGDDLTAVEIDFEVGDEPEPPPVAEVDDFFVPKIAGRADSHISSVYVRIVTFH